MFKKFSTLLCGYYLISSPFLFGMIVADDCISSPGKMSADTIWVADKAMFKAEAENAQVAEGELLVYVLHTKATDDLGEIMSVDRTGEFSNLKLDKKQLYFVSSVVGPATNDERLLKWKDPCLKVAPGSPVVFLSPIEVYANTLCTFLVEDCAPIIGNKVFIRIRGGYPDWNKKAHYQIDGDYVGKLKKGATLERFLAKGYDLNLSVKDNWGQNASFQQDYFVCKNIMPSYLEMARDTQFVCADNKQIELKANCTIIPKEITQYGAKLAYVLHTSPNDTLGTVLAKNYTGIFTLEDAQNRTNETFYVSSVLAEAGEDALPNTSSVIVADNLVYPGIYYIARGTPVVFLTPLKIAHFNYCEEDVLKSSFNVSGGYPAFNGEATYRIEGDVKEKKLNLATSLAVVIPDNELFAISVYDEYSCATKTTWSSSCQCKACEEAIIYHVFNCSDSTFYIELAYDPLQLSNNPNPVDYSIYDEITDKWLGNFSLKYNSIELGPVSCGGEAALHWKIYNTSCANCVTEIYLEDIYCESESLSDPGTMPKDTIFLKENFVKAEAMGVDLCRSDKLTYILHDSPNRQYGRILAYSETGAFKLAGPAKMEFSTNKEIIMQDSIVYISSATGPPSHFGLPNFLSKETQIAPGTPVFLKRKSQK